MALYLAQHGRSLSRDIDPGQGLSSEGIFEVEQIANLAMKYRIHVSCVKHSGKKRALQTAEKFASALNPPLGVKKTRGLNPNDDVEPVAHELNHNENLMLVGHLPYMERLVSFLIVGDTERPVVKFQNGGIVCLDKENDGDAWYIKWTLFPKID